MLYNAFVHTIINYINNTSPGFLDLEIIQPSCIKLKNWKTWCFQIKNIYGQLRPWSQKGWELDLKSVILKVLFLPHSFPPVYLYSETHKNKFLFVCLFVWYLIK